MTTHALKCSKMGQYIVLVDKTTVISQQQQTYVLLF